MKDNHLISDYILQQIKSGDLVEVELDDHQVIKGYIADHDVFKYKPVSLQFKENNVYGFPKSREKISLYEKSDIEKKPYIEITSQLFISTAMLPKTPIEIFVDQIVSIKKIDE